MRSILTLTAMALLPAAALADQPPAIVTAQFQDGNLHINVCKQVPVQKEVVVTVELNGKLVQEKRTVTVHEQVEMVQAVSLKGAKATSGGKELTEKELAERLAKSTPIVTSQGPIDAKYRKLFKDDAILIEFPVPAKPAQKG